MTGSEFEDTKYGYQLTKENLEKLKRGIKPESHPNAVTETCLC